MIITFSSLVSAVEEKGQKNGEKVQSVRFRSALDKINFL